MINIFVYGTLLFRCIWESVVEGSYRQRDAQIERFRRYRIKNRSYPALVYRPVHPFNPFARFPV